ncbi:MAG: bifunctional D-glycero-beta-D-manno-heptose-7-phosphate kinase/D-glycero-beta-D-manno-heptose 1-phosphate adenylyltransferase HldE [Rhodospirillales bacterium]|nr:bifunctional D-glycero-beta-D-manno-heptose-7-phosphate kinase/D-glycero-beta-D-manno-heptose 1-phosphate adenylyltransferase HldE [Rhodospirillales bacterium]
MTDGTMSPHREIVQAARVLIVGDIMLDRYVYGSVERISPEAPVPVLKYDRESAMPGGAANVARNICDFNAAVELVGIVGHDASSDDLGALAEGYPFWRHTVVRSSTRPTTTKTRLIADRHQIMRLDIEDTRPADAGEEAAVIAAVQAGVARASILVLSDYAKGALTEAVIRAAIGAAKAASLPVVVDPKSADFRRYAGATVVTPNANELARVVGRPCRDDEEVASGAAQLLSSVDIGSILVTRGDRGMTLVTRDAAPLHIRTTAKPVFDVSGAGDTVVAVLSVMLAEGVPLPTAADAANLAAGIVVSKLGTATVTRGEFAVEMRRRQEGEWTTKIVSLDQAAQRQHVWSAAGERVVFTNGCFDLLHPGHISLLRQAKAAGERLIVGLNTDASVQRLKGPTRPVQDEGARAFVLSALDCVDLVVLFDDDTPLRLIETLRPDVLVKGADYRPDQVVGREVIASYGGRLLLVDLEPDRSTTAMIERMRA